MMQANTCRGTQAPEFIRHSSPEACSDILKLCPLGQFQAILFFKLNDGSVHHPGLFSQILRRIFHRSAIGLRDDQHHPQQQQGAKTQQQTSDSHRYPVGKIHQKKFT